jgi:hypothetical protein
MIRRTLSAAKTDWKPAPLPAGEPMVIEVRFISVEKLVTGSL